MFFNELPHKNLARHDTQRNIYFIFITIHLGKSRTLQKIRTLIEIGTKKLLYILSIPMPITNREALMCFDR